MKIEIALRSAAAALRQLHILGAEANLFAGALKAIDGSITAIEEAKKEAAEDEDHDGQRKDA